MIVNKTNISLYNTSAFIIKATKETEMDSSFVKSAKISAIFVHFGYNYIRR